MIYRIIFLRYDKSIRKIIVMIRTNGKNGERRMFLLLLMIVSWVGCLCLLLYAGFRYIKKQKKKTLLVLGFVCMDTVSILCFVGMLVGR